MEMPNIDSHALPFLDVEVSITESNRFLTKVYRKPTNTDVIMKHCAIAPVKWKKSLLQLLLLRAKKLSSTQEAFEEEVKNIKRIFQSNGYPVSFIDNGVSSFLEKNEDNVTPKITDCEKMAYLVLPYIGKCSKRLHRKISAIMQGHEITLVQAFRTVKVESYFSLKTKIPYLFKSDVVYKFVCSRDENTQYIGESERQFFRRIKEHCTPSSSTNSAVLEHLDNCGSCSSSTNIVNCFSILRQCSKTDILSQETLCIRSFQPSLNVQLEPFKGTRVGLRIFN